MRTMTMGRMTVEHLIPAPHHCFIAPSASNLLILTFTLLNNPTFLTIYDSESFRSMVGFCMLPILCASIHPSPPDCLSNKSILPEDEYTHVSGWSCGCTGAGLLFTCTNGQMFWTFVFLDCCIPLSCFLCFTPFSYPYTPHSFRSWIGSISWKLMQGLWT
jgi:hypothetical protein